MNLTIEEGNKVRLPDEFVKFWNLSVGDEEFLYRGKETVVLVATDQRTSRKKQYREDIPLSEQMVKIVEKAGKPLKQDEFIFPNRLRSTIRARLSELCKEGKLKRIMKNGRSYYGRE